MGFFQCCVYSKKCGVGYVFICRVFILVFFWVKGNVNMIFFDRGVVVGIVGEVGDGVVEQLLVDCFGVKWKFICVFGQRN